MKTEKMTTLAILLALATALGAAETVLPVPIPAPGVRLGLSNILILTVLLLYGGKEALVLTVMKSFLLVLVTGSVSALFYSLGGGILSAGAMILGKKGYPEVLSPIGISELGSAFHNIGQIAVAAILVQNEKMFVYLPVLLVIGLITGGFVGFVSQHMAKILGTHVVKTGKEF